MDRVFVYWDNSNIFISAQQVAAEREGVTLLAIGSVCNFGICWSWPARGGRSSTPSRSAPFPRRCGTYGTTWKTKGSRCNCWNAARFRDGEQGVDQSLQTAMLRDAFDYNGDPGIAVLLTGDGSGFADGVGFHADLQRMRSRGMAG